MSPRPQPSVACVAASASAARPQRGKERRPQAQCGLRRSQSLEEIGGTDRAAEGRIGGRDARECRRSGLDCRSLVTQWVSPRAGLRWRAGLRPPSSPEGPGVPT
ncbi:hypothetical protein NDU88_003897 [Pleurodeles waltl]|uniref:Uncharacterized protein n=1 Tax=Pleurodeles waltl TaxID=8319 RepID=A0AAV7RGH0_PLEWA|nr:hypothetical protein NDU88_003897 [Pleurodeles waltl]